MKNNFKQTISAVLLTSILATPISQVYAATQATSVTKVSTGARINKMILEAKKMKAAGHSQEEIIEEMTSKLMNSADPIQANEVENYLALRFGFNSNEVKQFQQMQNALKNAGDGDGATQEEVVDALSKIVTSSESKAAPFMGNLGCGAPVAAFIGILPTLGGVLFLSNASEHYKKNVAGYGDFDLRKEGDVQKLNQTYQKNLASIEYKRQNTIGLMDNKIKLDLAINELRMQKENGLLKVDASALTYMRAESVNYTGIQIGGLGASSTTINYSGSSYDLLKSVGNVIDINTELRRLESYREVMGKDGAAGKQYVLEDINAKSDVAFYDVTNSELAKLYNTQDEEFAKAKKKSKSDKVAGWLLMSTIPVLTIIFAFTNVNSDCDD